MTHRRVVVPLIAAVLLTSSCATMRPEEGPPGVAINTASEHAGPAYFTQVTEQGIQYAHNWVNRPCFSVLLPSHEWVLQSATADYVMWKNGETVLKIFLSDNRIDDFAVSGMSPSQALRSFIGFEFDFIKPKFRYHSGGAPLLDTDENGVWAHWSWSGRAGQRAGVGKAIPADQKHRIASLWIDPWVLSFDFATTNLDTPDGETPDMKAVYRSLAFHNECFESMRSGETWGQTATNIAPPVAAEASDR